MEAYWIPITIFAICIPSQYLCAPLDDAESDGTKRQFGTQGSEFGSSDSDASFQAWKDWISKRSFGQFPFGDQNLQAWKEWMEKRGSLHPSSGPQFGASRGKAFQQWKDWMDKRGFSGNGHKLFKGMPPMSKVQFQTWNDWMVKRNMGGPTSGSELFGQPSGGDFQSWRDFSKKANFGKDPDFLGVGEMQPWHVMYKRHFSGAQGNYPFKASFGANPKLMKWDDMYKRNNDKRQLGSAPAEFGSYKQYFTNGLQDWRNTFPNTKRSSNSGKSSKHDNN